ncbi:hypothetical protein B0H14DRAFT_3439790 [Mycena olivaceomarginata]|nr:hypothetical protein B0H14DRAFT_3439790 [Mycena olivaceomarginata]
MVAALVCLPALHLTVFVQLRVPASLHPPAADASPQNEHLTYVPCFPLPQERGHRRPRVAPVSEREVQGRQGGRASPITYHSPVHIARFTSSSCASTLLWRRSSRAVLKEMKFIQTTDDPSVYHSFAAVPASTRVDQAHDRPLITVYIHHHSNGITVKSAALPAGDPAGFPPNGERWH